MECIFEAVFSVRYVLRLFNEDKPQVGESLKTVIRGEVFWVSLPACEEVGPAAEKLPPLEDVTKQRSEDSDWEY
jgi:hypothetical protein